jgi:hypothetical protein
MFRLASVLTMAVAATVASGAAAPAQTPEPVPMIQVTTPADVASVQSVNDAVSALSRKVTACVDGGRKLEICQCSAPQELASLRNRYDSLIKQRPAWKDQVMSYQYLDKDGRNISAVLALSTLRRQLDVLRCE